MIRLFNVHMPEAAIEAAAMTLRSGYIGQGPIVDQFERMLAGWFGTSNVLTVNSCTSALQLALSLAGVSSGDTVISTPMTCLATNCAIRAVGADIIWADVDRRTGCIDSDDIKSRIKDNTKALMVVHWGGNPVNLGEIHDVANTYGLRVIEDAAHALGSYYQGQKIGNHSDFVCFSFQAVKHVTTVDGGLLICRQKEDYERGRLLRWFGLDRRTPAGDERLACDVSELGFKFHMNDVAAAIGLSQFSFVDKVIRTHQRHASYYNDVLSLFASGENEDGRSSYWLYTIHVANRDAFARRMGEAGIEVGQVHRRNDVYSAFQKYQVTLPGVDEFSRSMVCIPVGWWLREEECGYIADRVKQYAEPRE